MSTLVDIFWFDVFVGGTQFQPSVLYATFYWGVATMYYFIFARVGFSIPLVSGEQFLKGFLPPTSSDSTFGQGHGAISRRLIGSAIGSLQIFLKVRIVNVRISGGSWVRTFSLVNYAFGFYFVSGWTWIMSSCPPWNELCN